MMTTAPGPAATRPVDGSLVHRARRLHIDSGQEAVVYLHRDSQLCRSEGFESETRVWVRIGSRAILATLNVITGELLAACEVGLSESAWARLGAADGSTVGFAHPLPLESLRHVRAKIHGGRLDAPALESVVNDIAAGYYSDINLAAFLTACAGGRLDRREMIDLTRAMIASGERLDAPALESVVNDIAAGYYSDINLAAFLTACAGDRLDRREMIDLTRAMIASGERLQWDRHPAMDKHSVGGLPGNRTTLLVVPIVTAVGVLMPKTSSRAITSPAGTADTMEMLAPVDLDVPAMRRVVNQEGGCIVWGGTVYLSPADDVLIRVERPLDLDSMGQLVASVLSKKAAAGATDVVIDIPVGPTAKVRSVAAAKRLCGDFRAVGQEVGLKVLPVLTDGTQPVGNGIGPALEARDVLAVLQGDPEAPPDLRERGLLLAGHILEMAEVVPAGGGQALAREILQDGRAWRKFQAICWAQGGMREPPLAPFARPMNATRAGRVIRIDNRRLARVAKLAGAPRDSSAGLVLHARVGNRVEAGQPLFTLHAEAKGELEYAMTYAMGGGEIIVLEENV